MKSVTPTTRRTPTQQDE